MRDLLEVLSRMPNSLGRLRKTALHPSGVRLPACPRRFLYSTRLGWRKADWREALSAGNILHRAMAVYYTGQPPATSVEQACKEAKLELAEEQALWAQEHPEDPFMDTRKREKAIGLGGMMGRVLMEAFPLPDTCDVVAIEQTLKSPDSWKAFCPVPIIGTVDAVLYDRTKEQYWLVDHKSTSDKPAQRAANLTFDVQAQLYRALWNSVHPERRVSGVIHNIIGKPGIRVKKGEKFEDYLDRCFEWYDKQALADPHEPPVQQSYVSFISPVLDKNDELQGLMSEVGRWHKRAVSLDSYPRVGQSFQACNELGGHVCPFMPLCLRQPSAWAEVLTKYHFNKADDDV